MPTQKGKKTTTAKSKKRIRLCPNCNSASVVPIMYGLPGAEAGKLQEEGKLKLGGCIVWDENPGWYCNDCEH